MWVLARLRIAGPRARLMALVCLSVIPALCLLLVTAWEQRGQEVDAAARDARRLATIAAGDQERLVAGAQQILTTLAQVPAVRERDSAACAPLLAWLLAQNRGYTNFSLHALDGSAVCSALPVGQSLNVSDRAWFQQVVRTDDEFVGTYQIGRVSGRPVLPIAAPVHDAAGSLRAVLLAGLDLGWAGEQAWNSDLPAGASLFVIDRDGTVLTQYPDGGAAGRSVTHTALVQAILARGAGSVEAEGLDGVRSLIGFAPLNAQTRDAYVAVSIPVSVALAPVTREFVRNISALGVVAAIAFAAAWFGAGFFILRPVRALARATSRLAAGEWDAPPAVESFRGEFRSLAAAFGRMADALHEREQALLAGEARFRALVQNVSDLILVLDSAAVIGYVSPSIERLLGYPPAEILGEPVTPWIHPDDVEAVTAAFQAVVQARPQDRIEFRVVHRDGSWRYLEAAATNALTDPNVHGVVVNARDVTERRRLEEQLAHQARTDPLTGLPNRRAFSERLLHATLVRRRYERIAVLFLDLDGFKAINDVHGHAAGDAVLIEVAHRLRRCARPADIVARLGGDEFTILLEDVPGAAAGRAVAGRILNALSTPFVMDDQEIYLTISIGIAIGPATPQDPDVLLARADLALHQAKMAGKAQTVVFDAEDETVPAYRTQAS